MGTNRLSASISSPTADFYLQADEISNNPATNQHTIRCYLVAVNRGNTSTFYSYANAVVSASVGGNGFSVSGNAAKLVSGKANGAAFWTSGPYDITVTGNPDGTAAAALTLSVSYPNAAGTGGSSAGSLPLATLTDAPGVPTDLLLARTSDTQAALSWTNNGATNGQPTSIQVRTSVNGAAFSQVASIAVATSLTLACAGNQKVIAQVRETNAAGSSAWSASSAAMYTTPAAPTDVAAAKDPAGDIAITWTPNVAFAEHQHVILHGTVLAGITTWDGAPLATVAAGTSNYTHHTPSPSAQHVYAVRAKNTDAGALTSADVVSNIVVLLTAPDKPTIAPLRPFADKAAAFDYEWVHNPVDSTAQTAYEVGYSTNGGTTWTSTGKVTSAIAKKTFAGGTYAANQALIVRVRTWGLATTGGSETTGASPWSDVASVTFKTKPVVTITQPADGSTYEKAQLEVHLGFAQAEGATFVRATIELYDGATLLETLLSTTLASTILATRVANGGSYTVKATVLDSNGLSSALADSDFDVEYTEPVAAGVTVTYLDDSGRAQLDLTFAAPGVGEAAAAAVTVQRAIAGITETVLALYELTDDTLTLLDTTPTIHGVNTYTVTTYSADGATVEVVAELEVAERRFAFLATGPGFGTVVRFSAALKLSAAPARSSALLATAGRARPIALFGTEGTLTVSATAELRAGHGSTPEELERFVLAAGIVCHRDPTGRRIFGALGSDTKIDRQDDRVATLAYTVSEAS